MALHALGVGLSGLERIMEPNSSVSPWARNLPPIAAEEESLLTEFGWGFGLSREDK
jgi:hypothetical protein